MLGLFDGPLGGAALFRSGRCIAVAHEDRMLRRSASPGMPRASVQAVLAATGIGGTQIDLVVVATRNAAYAEPCGVESSRTFCRLLRSLPLPPSIRKMMRRSVAASRRTALTEAVRSELGSTGSIRFLDHHLAHAVGAVCTTGLRSAVVATMDEGADDAWASMTAFDGSGATRLCAESGEHSLLALIDTVAHRLGIPEGIDRYRRLEELAARGAPLHYDRMEGGFRWSEGRLSVDDDLFQSGGILATLPRSAEKEDVASSILALVAEYARRWVVHWFVRTDQTTLVLSGDLFELPTVARAILDAPEIRHHRLSVIPGDRGLAVAAGYAAYLPGIFPEPVRTPPEVLTSPFVGDAFTEADVERALFREQTEHVRPPQVEADVARVLMEGRTVARFDGPAEIGDRGVGNRVILRSPAGSLQQGRIGFSIGIGSYHALIRAEAFPRYFRADGVHSLDLQCQPALVTPTQEFLEEFTGFQTYNGRVLVQTVTRAENPRLHELLTEFESWSGIPFLAAAPFRLPNQPLVARPRDAVRVFRLLGADYAALGPFLVPSFHESGVRMISTPSRKPAHGA